MWLGGVGLLCNREGPHEQGRALIEGLLTQPISGAPLCSLGSILAGTESRETAGGTTSLGA